MEMYLEELLVIVVYDGNGRREIYRGYEWNETRNIRDQPPDAQYVRCSVAHCNFPHRLLRRVSLLRAR